MSCDLSRPTSYMLVLLTTSFVGCGRAPQNELDEMKRVAVQAAADNEALRSEIRAALNKNSELTEQLRDATAKADQQRQARIEAERREAAEKQQRLAALAEA